MSEVAASDLTQDRDDELSLEHRLEPLAQDIRVVTVYRTSKVGKYWSAS